MNAHTYFTARVDLPSWAEPKRDLIEQIIAERPAETADRCRNWGHRHIAFHSPACSELRRYHEQLQREAMAVDDAAFFAGKRTTNFPDLMEQESPDELIGRLVR